MRGFLDRDFLETREGLFFCVVGPFHPKDRVISYLKYLPDKDGKWGMGERRFRRVMRAYTIPNLLETFELLESEHPRYLFYSSFYNIKLTAVPRRNIRRHYRPEGKLAELLKRRDLDSLQTRLVRLVRVLSEASNVPPSSFGVTGSILVDIHSPEFSDIDLTVYGLKGSLALKEALTQLYSSSSKVKRFKGKLLEAWCKSKAKKHPLSLLEARRIYERKWNVGVFDGTPFSIHPVKTGFEVTERYGDKKFRPEGFVTIRALVDDDSECMFLPAVYRVQDVEVLEGPKVSDILKVVSYESLYDNLAERGEKIVARGKLEMVEDLSGGELYHRVLVGSPEGRGSEFVKPA